MRRFHFYHRESGEFHRDWFMTDVERPGILERHTPPEHIALEGDYDRLSQRVDVTTGKVVSYQPAAPSADHEWDAGTKRWVLKPTVAAARDSRSHAIAEILRLERDVQPRVVRELLDGEAGAKERYEALKVKIAEQRAIITSTSAAPARTE